MPIEKSQIFVTKTDPHEVQPVGTEIHDVSRQGPEWFKVREKPLAKSASSRDFYG